MTRISRSRMDLEEGRADNAYLKDYGESVVGGASVVSTGSSYNVDLSLANTFRLVISANCTFTFSNPPPADVHCAFTIILVQGNIGSFSATWPITVSWPSGVIPTLTTSSGGADVLTFATYNGGATWFGFLAAQNFNISLFPFAYFGGGSGPDSSVDRIDYSNDMATAVTKGPLSSERRALTAVGNISFGYFGGGLSAPPFTNFTTVDRIDYSNDTATAVVKGPLTLARALFAASGNASFGYFAGGHVQSSGDRTNVDRIDYSNDAATTVAKGPLPATFDQHAGTGSSSFGYFGGGNTGVSTVNRIDYSNDTATALASGPLASARYILAATGNSAFGYFGAGRSAAPINSTSTVDRIDYSSDTSIAVGKGPLTLARFDLAAAGNAFFGYFGGGSVSTVDRVDYSNDAVTATATGSLSASRAGMGATNHAAGI